MGRGVIVIVITHFFSKEGPPRELTQLFSTLAHSIVILHSALRFFTIIVSLQEEPKNSSEPAEDSALPFESLTNKTNNEPDLGNAGNTATNVSTAAESVSQLAALVIVLTESKSSMN